MTALRWLGRNVTWLWLVVIAGWSLGSAVHADTDAEADALWIVLAMCLWVTVLAWRLGVAERHREAHHRVRELERRVYFELGRRVERRRALRAESEAAE